MLLRFLTGLLFGATTAAVAVILFAPAPRPLTTLLPFLARKAEHGGQPTEPDA